MTPQERKANSERLLQEMGVDINPNLPPIKSERATRLRSSEEIARRTICLTATTSRAFGDPKSFLIDYLKRKNCYSLLTEAELAFMNKARLTKRDKLRFTWHVEALRVLLWSIGYAELKPREFRKCKRHEDVYDNCSNPDSDGSAYISEAKLQSKSAILDLSDLIYRAHWATRQHSLDGKTRIGELDPDVVLEYHRAINWITCHDDLDWDDVSTDT